MDSAKYDAVILNNIEAFLDANKLFKGTRKGYIWMQDNALCYRLKTTRINLCLCNIPTIQ
jgi:hypothetical protein